MQKRYLLTYFILIAILASCQQPINVEIGTVERYTHVFMYATGDGGLRLLNIEYSDTDTIYQVDRYGSFSSTASAFGGADLTWYNTYDMSSYSESDTLVKAVISTRRINTINPQYNTEFNRMFISVNENRRSNLLRYFSDLNDRFEDLEQPNYPLNGDKSVRFVDQNSFLVLYTDRWAKEEGGDLPIDAPYSGKQVHLIRYAFNSVQPNLGEIITTFSIGDGREDELKDKPTREGWNNLHVSAKQNFYIVWAPYFNKLGYSPYIIRNDGSMAFNPGLIDFKWEDRYFGQSLFTFEPHPTADSLFMMGDIAHRRLALVELPSTLGTEFIQKKSKSIFEIFPQAQGLTWADFQAPRVWFMSFNPDGTKLAITHALPNVDPELVIWDMNTDNLIRYPVNTPNTPLEERYTYMGKAAWAFNNDHLVYFMAGTDTTENAGFADFFYINTESSQTFPAKVDYDNILYRNLVNEPLIKATDLEGR